MTREEANLTIDYLKEMQEEYIEGEGYERHPLPEWYAIETAIQALEQEPLTDKEQRIFLAAMGREEKICKEVDDRYSDREAYEDSLVSVCRSIERKVKKALWE